MKKVKEGFAFTAMRADSGLGIKEEFKITPQKDGVKIEAVFGVDIMAHLCKPAVLKQGLFVPVADLVLSCLDMKSAFDKFIRSNKAVYSLLQTTVFICRVSLRYSREDRTIMDYTVNLYSPKMIGNSESEIYLICSEVSTTKGIDTVEVNQTVYDGFVKSVIDFMQGCLGERSEFLKARLGVNLDEDSMQSEEGSSESD